MTTTEVVGHASDGVVRSNDSTYSNARAGANLVVNTNRTTLDDDVSGLLTVAVGQNNALSNEWCGEAFLRFDVSGIDSGDEVTAATLRMFQVSGSSTSHTVEARTSNWGATLTTGDWVAGASLGSLTLLASLASSTATNSSRDFTNNSTNLVAAIEAARAGDGWVYVLLNSSRHRIGNAPGGAEQTTFASSDHGTAANRPRLIIEHEPAATTSFLETYNGTTWDALNLETFDGANWVALPLEEVTV